MKISLNFLLLAGLLAIAMSSGCYSNRGAGDGSSTTNQNDQEKETAQKSRSFKLNYGASLKDVPKGASVRVWFPIAQTNMQQTVSRSETDVPGELVIGKDAKYGNSIGYFEVQSDGETPVKFGVAYDVKRMEASVDDAADALSESEKKNFLSANSLVPIDGKPQKLFKDLELSKESMAAGEEIYNLVEQHMKYDKSQAGYGMGDAEWACDSKTGNCTDFHSLFISLARSNSIPARFEIGFPLPPEKSEGKIGGYHCWAWFFADGKGWAPVDISEADKHPELKEYYFGKLTVDRVAF